MEALEADFWEYFHRDLRDLWRPNSGMGPRWVISHFHQLPPSSRVMKYLIGEAAQWGQQEHLLADIRDSNFILTYVTQYLLAAQLSKPGSFEEIMNEAPELPLRPGDEPKKPVELATRDELLQLFGGGGKPPRGRVKKPKRKVSLT